jgi:FkbM family methyltransferase
MRFFKRLRRSIAKRLLGRELFLSMTTPPAPPSNVQPAPALPDPSPPGSSDRPIGEMEAFLEDIRARGFFPETILDVGANQTRWSRLAKGIFPEASFLLIEPQSEMQPYLDAFCAESPGSRWIEAGAGASEVELTQTIYDDLSGSTFVPALDETLQLHGKQRKVKMITIDSLLTDGSPVPDLVKLDVQGFELEALRGASSIFGKTELLILESSLISMSSAWPIVREIVDFMGARGYEFYDIPGFLRRPLDGALGQVDFAFARANGFLRKSNGWDR